MAEELKREELKEYPHYVHQIVFEDGEMYYKKRYLDTEDEEIKNLARWGLMVTVLRQFSGEIPSFTAEDAAFAPLYKPDGTRNEAVTEKQYLVRKRQAELLEVLLWRFRKSMSEYEEAMRG